MTLDEYYKICQEKKIDLFFAIKYLQYNALSYMSVNKSNPLKEICISNA